MKIDYCPHCKLAIAATCAPPDLTAAVVTAARELVAHAEGDTEPTVDGYDLDRLRTALVDCDAAKGGQ
jgi:hypothetical protein